MYFTLPFAVTLYRFAALFFVFIFGIAFNPSYFLDVLGLMIIDMNLPSMLGSFSRT